jgi:predicted nucleic acid-binding protein
LNVFADSSYYLALANPRDQWYRAALKAPVAGFTLVTSSLVISETATRLQQRGLFSTALEFLQAIRHHSDIQIIYPDAALQAEAWDLLAQWGGSGANAVDCASFAIMRRFRIRKAFTFDAHFRKAGFEILKP